MLLVVRHLGRILSKRDFFVGYENSTRSGLTGATPLCCFHLQGGTDLLAFGVHRGKTVNLC